MANKKCELPPGSYRTPHKGHEEVHVSALMPKLLAFGEKLVKISEMPEYARPTFKEMMLHPFKSWTCIVMEEDMYLNPSNLGLIVSYYYISYTTIERFSSSLSPKIKMKGLLDILASASEYAQLPILRPGEEDLIRKLIHHQRFSFENHKCTDPHVKANALLQAPQAMVNVISSNGWLTLALLAMEMC